MSGTNSTNNRSAEAGFELPEDEDPEKLIEYLDAHRPAERPFLRVPVAALRLSLEVALSIRSDHISFSTVPGPETRLHIWAQTGGRIRLTSLPWNASCQVSTVLGRDVVSRLTDAMKPVEGILSEYSDAEGCTIDGVTIPWTSEAHMVPPRLDFSGAPSFELNHKQLQLIRSSKVVVVARDYPDGGLRIVPDGDEEPLYPLSVGPWPERDIESRFAMRELRMLVKVGKQRTRLFCLDQGESGVLRLGSYWVFKSADTDVCVRTAIVGEQCEHPPREEPGLHPLEFFPLDDDREELRNLSQAYQDNERSDNPGWAECPTNTTEVTETPTFASLTNVGASVDRDEIGLTQVMELADVGTPDESATCEEIVRHVKLLTEVLGAIELSFNIKMAKLLWRAKRVYGGEEKFEEYAARELGCSTRTVFRFVQIGREISETDYSRIPPPFQKVQYLTIIASGLKKGEDLVDIIESLEGQVDGEQTSEDPSVPPVTGEHGPEPDATSPSPNDNASSEDASVEATSTPKPGVDHPTIRGGEAFLGKPLRLSSKKGSVHVTITRVEVSRSIVQRTLDSTDGDTVALGGFRALVDVDLITR